MSDAGIKRTRKAAPWSKAEPKSSVKMRPNIAHKVEAQLSQETFLDEGDEFSSIADEYKGEENLDEGDDLTQLIEYEPDEIDIDTDSDILSDNKDSIFDASEDYNSKIKPDIVMEEVVSYPEGSPVDIDIFIPSKSRLSSRNITKEYEIRTEALEKIGGILAKRDKAFLLNDIFNPSLITVKKQKEIAKLIAKDETWITRLKQSCVVQTPKWGLQPLALFFPEETPQSIEVFSDSVIRCINNEDPLKPLSIKDLASLISKTDSEYKLLASSAGSKLRRILEKLSIPPPQDRFMLAKTFVNILDKHRCSTISEIIQHAEKSDVKKISNLIAKYKDFSDKLIQRLKSGKASQ